MSFTDLLIKHNISAPSGTAKEKKFSKLLAEIDEHKLIKNVEEIIKVIHNEAQTKKFLQIKAKFLEIVLNGAPKIPGNIMEKFSKYSNTLSKSTNSSYDASSIKGNVEIKSSRCLYRHQNNGDTVLSQTLQHAKSFVSFYDIFVKDYDCNIQQVKLHNFNTLYYYLWLDDVVLEFQASSDDIQKNKLFEYSNKMHAGNEGEGQFHIKNNNIVFHLAHTFKKAYNYHEFTNILNNLT